jgi:peptidoglycan/LPS O-acetylase OafA/YrhL
MIFKYRPEIDGLRAIAVSAVVLYHAEFNYQGQLEPFKGGFIGVDVFFVISGYLIASIILRELGEGEFSFSRFYERRARRILPVLCTVMLVSIPFSWMYLLPQPMMQYAGSVVSALGFSSNFWFWLEDSYYWAESSALKPFLHTWSLSVEEQFYILFPVVVVVCWKVIRNHIASMLVIGFLGSLLLAQIGSVKFPSGNFFLLPTRGWELCAGALMAKMELDKGREGPPILKSIMPAVGLSLICGAAILFDNDLKHPSFITLFPVVGAMLLIWFCNKGELVTDILSMKPFVGVGLISYSFYLWHYPIFAFFRTRDDIISDYQKLHWIPIAIILSIASFYLIEQPARKNHFLSLKHFITICTLVFGLLVSSALFVLAKEGMPSRLGFDSHVFKTSRMTDYKSICQVESKGVTAGQAQLLEKGICQIGSKNKQPNFLLFGDSHALSMMHLFHKLGSQRNINGGFLFQPGCPPILGGSYQLGVKEVKKCREMNRLVQNFVVQHDSITTLFLVARWEIYLNENFPKGPLLMRNSSSVDALQRRKENLKNRIIHTVREFQNLGKKVVIVLQVPDQRRNPLKSYRPKSTDQSIRDDSILKAKHLELQKSANDMMREIADGRGIDVVDPTGIMCSSRCLIGNKAEIYYYDSNHLSITGASLMEPAFSTYFGAVPDN